MQGLRIGLVTRRSLLALIAAVMGTVCTSPLSACENVTFEDNLGYFGFSYPKLFHLITAQREVDYWLLRVGENGESEPSLDIYVGNHPDLGSREWKERASFTNYVGTKLNVPDVEILQKDFTPKFLVDVSTLTDFPQFAYVYLSENSKIDYVSLLKFVECIVYEPKRIRP